MKGQDKHRKVNYEQRLYDPPKDCPRLSLQDIVSKRKSILRLIITEHIALCIH